MFTKVSVAICWFPTLIVVFAASTIVLLLSTTAMMLTWVPTGTLVDGATVRLAIPTSMNK